MIINPSEIVQSIKQDERVIFNKTGRWKTDHRIFQTKTNKLIQSTKSFVFFLNHFETQANVDENVIKGVCSIGEALLEKWKGLPRSALKDDLHYRMNALLYRYNISKPSTEVDKVAYKKIKEQALEWKRLSFYVNPYVHNVRFGVTEKKVAGLLTKYTFSRKIKILERLVKLVKMVIYAILLFPIFLMGTQKYRDLAKQALRGVEVKVSSYTNEQLRKVKLNKIEKSRLKDATKYPELCGLLDSHAFLTDFFKWIIRDNLSVQSFAEFPNTSHLIRKNCLSGRIGRDSDPENGDLLRVEEIDGYKNLTLPMESADAEGNRQIKRVSLLNPTLQLEFPGNKKITLAKYFKKIADKKNDPSTYDFVNGLITRWNSFTWKGFNFEKGRYEPMDISREDWWQKLPHAKIKKGLVEARYGKRLADGEWLVFAKGARETPKLHLDKAHGWDGIAIPDGAGYYSVLEFGKFSKRFPRGLEKVGFIGNTVEATMEFPESNTSYGFRQVGIFAINIDEVQGKAWLEIKREQMDLARRNWLTFMYAYKSCAYEPQKTLKKVIDTVPNLFKVPFLECTAKNPILKGIVKLVNKLPQTRQKKALRILTRLFRPKRGIKIPNGKDADGKKIYKMDSLSNSNFGKSHNIYYPGALPHRIVEEKQQGEIRWGHTWNWVVD